MAVEIGDTLALRVTVAERVHLGGDYNLRLEANGRSFWLTESALAAFLVDAHPHMVWAQEPTKGQAIATATAPSGPPPRKAPKPPVSAR